MDSLIVLHRLSVALHGATGAVCAAVGVKHIWDCLGGAVAVLSKGTQPLPVEVVVGLLAFLPGALVVVSVPPMIRGSYTAFRSGASAAGVLLVALIGLLSIFGNMLALQLSGVVVADLVLIATFGETRRRRRRSDRGLPPGL